jgi:hypothetical protein
LAALYKGSSTQLVPTELLLDGQRRISGLAYTIDRSEGTGIPEGIGYYNPVDDGEGWRPPWRVARGSKQDALTPDDYNSEHSPTLPPAWQAIERRYPDFEVKQESDTIPAGRLC